MHYKTKQTKPQLEYSTHEFISSFTKRIFSQTCSTFSQKLSRKIGKEIGSKLNPKIGKKYNNLALLRNLHFIAIREDFSPKKSTTQTGKSAGNSW